MTNIIYFYSRFVHFPKCFNLGVLISGAGIVCLLDDHAIPDTSMRLSEYVLQTFSVNIISLAIANFSIFKMANGNFKMAAKFIC